MAMVIETAAFHGDLPEPMSSSGVSGTGCTARRPSVPLVACCRYRRSLSISPTCGTDKAYLERDPLAVRAVEIGRHPDSARCADA